jgi:RHS repeat-associated protein
VAFPDSTTLSFTWEKNYSNNTYYTGRLASITLPTGGTVSYAYSGGTNGINCLDGTPATMTRTTPDGTWTYTHVASTYGSGPITTTVTDPKGNNTVYTFSDDVNNLQIEKQVYNGSVTPANLIETVFNCYNNPNSTPSISCSGSLPVASPVIITQKDDYTTYSGVTGYSAVKTSYDTYGRVTDVKTFDFNATTPTTEKTITYGSGNPSTQQCTAISTTIIGKPCSVTLLDSQHSNATLSQTWNAYDSNGNLTQTWSLAAGSGSSGTYLSKQYTYTNGVVQTAIDVNGQVMNYTTTSCNNMFTTSQYPTGFINLQTSQTWDCNGGVVTSNTDANGQTTHSLFSVNTSSDPFYRPLESTDQLGNITTFSYAPTTVESIFSFNGGSSVIDTLSTTDSIARPVVSQLRQGPGSTNWSAKSRTFDGAGRPYQTTLPCVSTAGAACSAQAETQTYDGLDRPLVHTTVGGEVITKTYVANDVRTTLTPAPANENAKATQREFDGLGRLKSVCLISSASGSGPCGQANGGTGFLTRYTYDAAGRLLNTVENAQVSSPQQTRSYTYDLLGRVLTETNPESGTTHNTFDSVTGTNCTSTSVGDLVQRIDANGNTTCYFYDGLHRNIKISYAGPNSNGVSKYFVYDSATVNGTAMSYAEGHLAEAYTCSGSCTSKITDEGFSYDQRGAMADYYQSSTNSGGYYHLSGTYWEHGAIKTVSGVGLPTITYGGLDGVGRVTTVTASSGTNPVSAVTYNNGTYSNEPIGALLTVTLGTSDAQNFTYDPNTGRMTSYSASVGATPQVISGALTWNQNGTLLQNNISDAYNAGNTQNCAYLYDDLMRAASVNCVNGATNIWNQTFTYSPDSFGNITKSGTGSFQPLYSATTNQITLLPGNHVPTYDADGNLTNDSYHGYTWLADGHVATIDTSTITYDAMGNKVEENVGGTTHEYVSAFGVSAQMTAQSENATTVVLPGGLQALYSGGTLQRFRFPDWQGTIRAESSTARVFTESLAFAPFGERYAVKGAPYNVDSFTGSPNQIVPDEYDFSARELHNGQGRWISPDPMPGPGNKYAYVGNDPLSHVDYYGLLSVEINGLQVGTIDDTNQLTIKGMSESYKATSAEAAAEVNFMCGSLDCTAPGTDRMLQGMGLIAPPPSTQTANNQQQAQAAQSQQQGQPAQQPQQQLVIVPDRQKDSGPGLIREQDVYYEVYPIDKKGNIASSHPDNNHTVELREKVLSGDVGACVNAGSCKERAPLVDTMRVPAGAPHSVEKRFTIDGKSARIYDPGTKKTFDYIRVDASLEKGFVFSYRNNSP